MSFVECGSFGTSSDTSTTGSGISWTVVGSCSVGHDDPSTHRTT